MSNSLNAAQTPPDDQGNRKGYLAGAAQYLTYEFNLPQLLGIIEPQIQKMRQLPDWPAMAESGSGVVFSINGSGPINLDAVKKDVEARYGKGDFAINGAINGLAPLDLEAIQGQVESRYKRGMVFLFKDEQLLELRQVAEAVNDEILELRGADRKIKRMQDGPEKEALAQRAAKLPELEATLKAAPETFTERYGRFHVHSGTMAERTMQTHDGATHSIDAPTPYVLVVVVPIGPEPKANNVIGLFAGLESERQTQLGQRRSEFTGMESPQMPTAKTAPSKLGVHP